MTTLLISAGDASGDLHAADFAREYAGRHPEARIFGLGGDAMRRAGVELVAPSSDLAVGGLFELAGQLPRIVSVWRRMDRALREIRPDLVVLVDSGGFNIPFAKRVRKRSEARILYFVAPQVWAWRPGRIQQLARRVDHMAVIFPFEPDVYTGTGLPVDYVGHPLADAIGCSDRDAARARLGCERAAQVVALLPGSRRNEVQRQFPVQLDACRLLRQRLPRLEVLVARAPSVERSLLDAAAHRSGESEFRIVDGAPRDVMLAADVVLAKPGTVTVELALLGRPMVVLGLVHRLTARVLRRMVKITFYAMPNLVAGREIVPEFLQQDAEPAAVAEAMLALFEGPRREQQLKDLTQVREALAKGGAAAGACGIAEALLGQVAR